VRPYRQSVAETAYSPFGGVIRRITGNRQAATGRRHLKDVAVPLPAHHWHGGACGVHHIVEACVNDSLEILGTHLLEGRKLPVTGNSGRRKIAHRFLAMTGVRQMRIWRGELPQVPYIGRSPLGCQITRGRTISENHSLILANPTRRN